MKQSQRQTTLKRRPVRKFLKTAGGAMAAGAFSAYPLRGWAADPVNIGGLYPVTGSMAQIGVGIVAAAKLAVEMVNQAGGYESLGGAKITDHLGYSKRYDRHPHGNGSPDLQQQVVSHTRLLCQRLYAHRERSRRAREDATADWLELRSTQQGP